MEWNNQYLNEVRNLLQIPIVGLSVWYNEEDPIGPYHFNIRLEQKNKISPTYHVYVTSQTFCEDGTDGVTIQQNGTVLLSQFTCIMSCMNMIVALVKISK